MNDEFALAYYNTDDGIWIIHDPCKTEKNLGFWPTLEQALEFTREHRCEQ